MADGVELGTAFIAILPEVSKIGSGIRAALNDAAGDVESAGRGLGDILGVSLTRSLKDPLGSLTTMLGNLGQVGGDGALGLSAGAVGAASAVGAVAAATVAVTAEFYKMGEAWASVADNIAWQTGAIGDRMNDLTNMAGQLSTQVAQTPEQLGNVLGQLSDGPLKLTDAQLKSLTYTLGQYNENHPDAIANTQALTQVFLEFGVPAGAMVDTLDQLNLTAEHSKIPFNTLAQELATIGPTADLLGISLAQTTNLLKGLAEAGVDPSTAITSLRIGLKNLVDDIPAVQKAMGGSFAPDESALDRLKQTVQMIEQLHQKAVETGDQSYEIQAQDIGNSVFGRGWTAIVDAIEKGRVSAQSLGDTAREQGPSIDTLTQATEHFKEKWQETGADIKLALKPLADDVFKVLDDGLTNFDDHLKTVMNNPAWSFIDKLSFLNFGVTQPASVLPNAPLDSGAGHTGESGAQHRSGPAGGVPPTGPADTYPSLGPVEGGKGAKGPVAGSYSVDTSAAFYPLDLNAADVPPGEKYDSWISKQKELQSALNRRDDANIAVAKATEKQSEVLAKSNATDDEKNNVNEQLTKALRAQQEATQNVTIAQNKLAEGADQTTKAFHLSGGGFIGDLINLIAAMVTESNTAAAQAAGSVSPAGTIPALAQGSLSSPPSTSPGASFAAAPGGPGGVSYSGGAGSGGLLGPPLPGGAPSAGSINPAGLTGKDAVAADIINAARARGLNQEQTLAALSTGILESALGSNSMTNVPQNQSGTVVQGVFQQDSSYNKYGGRTDPSNAAKGFVDQFVARGGLNMDPYQAAVKVQVGTYGPDYVRSFRSQALDYYNRLAPGYASGGAVDSVPAMLAPGEHVLTAEDVAALGGQAGVYSMRNMLHRADGGAIDPAELLKQQQGSSSGQASGSGRTKGFIPIAGTQTGTPGTGMWSGIMNLGDEVANSLIDQGIQAAESAISMAAAAGGAAAGGGGAAAGPAAGAAANLGLGIAGAAGKVGAKYGFSLAGIAGDSLLEILSPFGTPRWAGYNVQSFLPDLSNVAQPVSTLEKALQQQQQLKQGGGGGSPDATDAVHQGTGAQPGGPVAPSLLPGQAAVAPPVSLGLKPAAPTTAPPAGAGPLPAAGLTPPKPTSPATPQQKPPTQSTTDPLAQLRSIMGYDEGGMLPPGGIGVNMTQKPEPVFTDTQWQALKVQSPDQKPNFGVYIENLHAADAEDVKRQIDNQQRLAQMRFTGRPYA